MTGREQAGPKDSKKAGFHEKQIAQNPAGWSAKQVMNMIYEKTGVRYHEVHVYRLLRQWGYTPKELHKKRFVNSATAQEKQSFKTLRRK